MNGMSQPCLIQALLPGPGEQANHGLAGDDQDRSLQSQGGHFVSERGSSPLPWVYRLGEVKTVSMAQVLVLQLDATQNPFGNEVNPSLHPGPRLGQPSERHPWNLTIVEVGPDSERPTIALAVFKIIESQWEGKSWAFTGVVAVALPRSSRASTDTTGRPLVFQATVPGLYPLRAA